jgi:hypothetical protein
MQLPTVLIAGMERHFMANFNVPFGLQSNASPDGKNLLFVKTIQIIIWNQPPT